MRFGILIFGIFLGVGCGGKHRDQNVAAESAPIVLTDGFFSVRGVTYEVDDDLNLDVVRRVRVELRPQALPPGRYILRYALVNARSGDVDGSSELLSAGHLEVNHRVGNLVADIPVRVRDLRLLGSRNHLIVELKDAVFESAMEPSGSAQLMFKPFDLSVLGEAVETQLAEFKPWSGERNLSAGPLTGVQDLERLAERIKELEAERNRQLKSNFARSQNLIDWPDSVGQMGEVRRDSMLSALRSHSPEARLYRALCELWVDQILPELSDSRAPKITRGLVDSCMASRSHGLSQIPVVRWLAGPYEPFFLMQDVFAVDSARINKVSRPKGRQFAVQVGERFYVRSRVEYNYEAGMHPLSWIPIVGPYLSLAGTLAIDVSHKDDEGKDLHFAVDMPLNVEESVISLEFLDYKRCLIVRANPAKFDDRLVARYFHGVRGELERDQLRRAFGERGLFVCDTRSVAPVTKAERYYYIYSGKEVGYQHDPGDFANRQVSLPLRGLRDFKAVMGAAKARLVASPGANSAEFDGSGDWAAGVESGVLSSSPASPGIFLNEVFY